MSQGFAVLGTVANAAVPLITAIAQSRATKAQASYESSILESNARIAELQAADAIRRGNLEAEKIKKQTRQVIGAQRAALAAQGLELGEDDAAAIQADTAEIGALDVLDTKNNAWREAWGYKVRARNYSTAASFSRQAASNASRNTILTGGLSFARDLAYGLYSMSGKSSTTVKPVY